MDSIVQILYFLLHWRFTLSVFASAAAALVLSNFFVGFTAGYCIILVLLGTAFGLIWQGRVEAGTVPTDSVPETKISHPVAFMGFAVIGLFCGGTASFLLHSEILAALALVFAVASVGAWYKWGLNRAVSIGYLAFVAVSLLIGYGSMFLLMLASS